MLGPITGDIIGSTFEFNRTKSPDFPLFPEGSRFTDDTVLTVATAFSLLTDGDWAANYRLFGRLYPLAGYGASFRKWLAEGGSGPYNSWGNGSAMRVAPVAWAFDTEQAVLATARDSAAVTHDHPEGIKGAQATALAVFLARQGADKETIRAEISGRFGYDLDRATDEIRPCYAFDVSCQGSVPEALTAVANDYGGVDLLVCDAGIASRGRAVADTDPQEMIRVVTTHAFGPHHMCRLVLPSMRARATAEGGRGDIIMISSVATSHMGPNGAPYNMGKAAMEALASTLAKEERRNNIHVNTVAPGLVETDMGVRLARAMTGNREMEDLRSMDAASPFGRVCQPLDIAEAVLWLCSPGSGYVTGQRIEVDGGGRF